MMNTMAYWMQKEEDPKHDPANLTLDKFDYSEW